MKLPLFNSRQDRGHSRASTLALAQGLKRWENRSLGPESRICKEEDDLVSSPKDPLEGRALKGGPRPLRRRASAERQRAIAAEAARYFAEHGFDGNTRALAKELGVSQALLFKYFPTKRDLIDRIYEDVFVGRWNPAWETWIEDETVPLDQRICRFYLDYARVILSYEWVRLYMFSSLKGFDLAKRYSKILRARIFPKVIAAIRSSQGLPTPHQISMTNEEMEIVASLHAAIFYLGVRQWIYDIPLESDIETTVTTKVRAFLLGAPAAFGEALKPLLTRRTNAGGAPFPNGKRASERRPPRKAS